MAYGTLNAGAITPGSGNTLTISEAVTVPTPTATTHAATKSYVDTAATQATTAAQGVGTGDSPEFAGLDGLTGGYVVQVVGNSAALVTGVSTSQTIATQAITLADYVNNKVLITVNGMFFQTAGGTAGNLKLHIKGVSAGDQLYSNQMFYGEGNFEKYISISYWDLPQAAATTYTLYVTVAGGIVFNHRLSINVFEIKG